MRPEQSSSLCRATAVKALKSGIEQQKKRQMPSVVCPSNMGRHLKASRRERCEAMRNKPLSSRQVNSQPHSQSARPCGTDDSIHRAAQGIDTDKDRKSGFTYPLLVSIIVVGHLGRRLVVVDPLWLCLVVMLRCARSACLVGVELTRRNRNGT